MQAMQSGLPLMPTLRRAAATVDAHVAQTAAAHSLFVGSDDAARGAARELAPLRVERVVADGAAQCTLTLRHGDRTLTLAAARGDAPLAALAGDGVALTRRFEQVVRRGVARTRALT